MRARLLLSLSLSLLLLLRTCGKGNSFIPGIDWTYPRGPALALHPGYRTTEADDYAALYIQRTSCLRLGKSLTDDDRLRH